MTRYVTTDKRTDEAFLWCHRAIFEKEKPRFDSRLFGLQLDDFECGAGFSHRSDGELVAK